MKKRKASVSEYRKLRRKDLVVSLLFISPLLILVTVVTFIPILTAFKWSLHDTKYLNLGEFAGLNNYINIFREGDALKSIFNSLWYVAGSLLLTFPAGIGLAVLLNRKFKGQTILRTLIIVPWVISQTITAMLWRWMYNSSYGVLTFLFEELFGTRIEFLAHVLPARLSVLAVNFWNTTPVVIIMTLAALQSIPSDIYEAARVDGSGGWQSFRRITLPLLRPTLAITVVMQSIEYLNMVTLLNTMTDGGPFKGTMTLSVYAYRECFISWHIGESSAISILILIMNVVFSILYIRILKGKEG